MTAAPIILTDPADDDLDEPSEPMPEAAELRAFTVGADQHGLRLDRLLAELVPEFSRNHLQQLIAAGAVQLAGSTASKPAVRVQAGLRGTIELRPTEQSQSFRPEPIALETVYRDDHLRVLDKPAGLVVHPAPGNWSGTLLNALLADDPASARLPRAGIVHRLDKDTSGLMVVARDRASMDALVQAIAARTVQRRYLALAHGRWQGPARRSIEAAIGRDARQRLRMAVVDPARSPGKPARTDVELLQQGDSGCLVRCTLHTGRTHQIRVHLAAIGHPLVGDALYGGAAGAGMTRQALHAYSLELRHPASGRPLSFRAPLPGDLRAALQAWNLGGDFD